MITTNKDKILFSKDMDFVSEFDNGHILERLYIYWDILTKCNFNCSYCYARKEYDTNAWNKEQNFSRQKLIIYALSKSKVPIFLGFHGGEPTLDKNFLELVSIALKKLHKKTQIYIATNGSTNVFNKIFKERLFQNDIERLWFLFSCHFEHKNMYGVNFEKFFNNIQLMKSAGFKVKANILLLPNKKYWTDIKFVFNKCLKLCKTHPHFIYTVNGENEIIYNYSNDFFIFFKDLMQSQCTYIFETEKNSVEITDYTVFKEKLNRFKNWKCYNNNYEIKIDGTLQQICSHKKINLIQHPLALAKINKINYMICPYDNCLSDGVLKCFKTKN